jgi:hypothetical protein
VRDLVGAREDARCDLMRARHRLSTLRLGHGVRFADGVRWTQRHHDWLSRVELPDRAADAAFQDYLGAVRSSGCAERRSSRCSPSWSLPALGRGGGPAPLPAWRHTLTALGLCAEVGEFGRFEHPKQLMSFVGLVPSEQSSGERRWQGPIAKSGSLRARRLLVEAAWALSAPPRRGPRARAPSARPRSPSSSSWSGRHSDARTAAGSGSTDGDARGAPSSRWRSCASSPAFAVRWPPPSGAGQLVAGEAAGRPSRRSIREYRPWATARAVMPDPGRRLRDETVPWGHKIPECQTDHASRSRRLSPSRQPPKSPPRAAAQPCLIANRRPCQVGCSRDRAVRARRRRGYARLHEDDAVGKARRRRAEGARPRRRAPRAGARGRDARRVALRLTGA